MALLLSAAGTVPAAAQVPTFYVATDGSDAGGDGSAADPWATITHALGEVPDGSLIQVEPGTYNGQVDLVGTFTQGVTVRSLVPYQARLRHTSTVVRCFYGQGIALEGFDVAHSGSGAGALVVQIQDLIDGAAFVERIVLRRNVFHDSFNNDLVKINNGARNVRVEGNLFYNQQGSDEHLDINSVIGVTIEGNVFFNDFEGSGRPNANDTSSFIVIKDSNGTSDGIQGARFVTVARNVFLNWQGSTGSNFVLLGEDGNSYYEARDVLVENNLMLGNSAHAMRASIGTKGARDATFRHNTVVGDLPSLAFAMRLNVEGANPANLNVRFLGNIWSDPTGTLGSSGGGANDFSDTPPGETASFTLRRNLYWNGGAAIPSDGAELVNYTDDAERIVASPLLPALAGIVLPRWNQASGTFADGSASIAEVFGRLVRTYGAFAAGSPATQAGDPAEAPAVDILGHARIDGAPDLGAWEDLGEIFSDGFESGDLSAWSVVAGEPSQDR